MNNTVTSEFPANYKDAWKQLLFGVLVGTSNYIGGHITKGTIESVMLAMGFNTHEYTDESFVTITKTVTTGGNEVTTTQSP